MKSALLALSLLTLSGLAHADTVCAANCVVNSRGAHDKAIVSSGATVQEALNGLVAQCQKNAEYSLNGKTYVGDNQLATSAGQSDIGGSRAVQFDISKACQNFSRPAVPFQPR